MDLNNDVIAIKGTKTKYDRYIPISKPLKGLLGAIEKKDDCLYVFNNKGAKLGNFRKSFMTAAGHAGLKDLRIHDLRHVFASKMVMNDINEYSPVCFEKACLFRRGNMKFMLPLYITGELLGHRTTQMTKRYSHLVPDTLKKAVDDVFEGWRGEDENKEDIT